MTPDRYAQIKGIFLEACARAPAERGDFLAQRCGADAALRAEIEALLAVHTEIAAKSAPDNNAGAIAAGGPPRRVPQRDFQTGAIVAGRFRIVELLGRGGMGEVYRVEDLRLNQPVALKFLPVEFATSVPWLERLHREVQLARTITHPNVCRVFDLNETAGDYFISMEYVDGENLKSLLARVGRLPGDRAAQLAWQLCAGLAAAHAKGVLHRDLKPANVMLDGRGNIRILDFGLAALHDQVRGAEIRVGTPGYMAPEQLTGAGVSVRSDVYALGLVLYELYTGRPALRPSAVVEARQPPPAPSSVVPEISPAAEHAILRCLEPDPASRPGSVLELAATLLRGDAFRMAQELGETPSPTVVAAAGQQRVSRRSARALLAAFAALLGLACVLGPHSHPLGTARSLKPPEVLAEKAREYLAAGRSVPPGDPRGPREPPVWGSSGPSPLWEAYGFTGDVPLEPGLGTITPTTRFIGGTREPLFWYRIRGQPLTPLDAERIVFGRGRATLDDPPFGVPGEATLVLDAAGRLRAARIAPQAHGHRGTRPDWTAWHSSAGRAPESLRPVEPDPNSPVLADERWAWIGIESPDPNQALRVQAAAFQGQPISYAVLTAAPDADAVIAAERADLATRHAIANTTMFVVLGGLGVLALPLARENLRRGRSDPRGAMRLAGFVFAARMVASLLQTTHSPVLVDECRLITLILTGAAGNAVLVWLYYLALEPFARRYRPQLLISWVRLLAGDFRDPLVGRDLLLGAVLGVSGCLLFYLEDLLRALLGLSVRPRLLAADFFVPSLSLRQAFGFLFDVVRMGMHTALWITLMVVLLRHVTRRAVLAGIVGALLIGVYLVPLGSNVATSLVFLGIGVGGGLVWAALRYGLVPVAVAVSLMMLLLRLPLTLDFRAWYFERGLLALVSAIAVAVYGWHSATRRAVGEPVVR